MLYLYHNKERGVERMKFDKGGKVKVNGTIQEIENITQWDTNTQRYKFVGVSGWHEIKIVSTSLK